MPNNINSKNTGRRARKTARMIFAAFTVLFFIGISFISFLLVIRLSYQISLRQEWGKTVSDSIVKIAAPDLNHIPEKISQPIIQKIGNWNEKAFSKPLQEYVVQASMVPTPFVMYAPARGDVFGDFHNNEQFRYPEDLGPKGKNEIRIFITGGSTAWGTFAPDLNTTISAFLEKKLNKGIFSGYTLRVINAAAGGWGTTEEAVWILTRITEYEPDLIISYSGHNDIGYLTDEKKDIYTNMHNEAGYFFAGLKEYDKFNIGKRPVDFIQDYSSKYYKSSDFPRKILKNIEIISSYLNIINVPYIFVLQPFNKNSNMDSYIPYYETLVKALDEEQKNGKTIFTFIDHSSFFDGREEYFTDAVHFGDLGYEIIATDLHSRLRPIIDEIIKSKKD